MKVAIETARDLHRVRTEEELKALHAAFIARNAVRLRSVRIHAAREPKQARVNYGAWVFDCDCGAGVGADPEFTAAYCFGCGAIHTDVRFPERLERRNIEGVLLERPKSENRNWDVGESLEHLRADNDRHGVSR
jgi:hypothetical protein